jgi:acetyl-CoA acetyltransferase
MAGREVAIAGVGFSTIGRRTGLTLPQLTAQCVTAALLDSGLDAKDVDGVATHCFPYQFVSAVETGGMMGFQDLAWLSGNAEGPSFISAAIHAIAAVASGSCEVAVAIRTIQKDGAAGLVPSERVSGWQQFVEPFGGGAGVQWAAMFMQRMMYEFGWTEESFGNQMIAQREFAALNENALIRDPLTMEQYLSSRSLSRPVKLLDCDYPVDSGSAVIFTTAERARDLKQPLVLVDSWSFGTLDRPWGAMELTPDMTKSSPHNATRRMWEKTSLKPSDLDVAGIYDGFSMIVMNWLEALGVCGRGEAADFVAEGNTRLGGSLPVNCDGGSANVGRTHGANHMIEVVRQLRGQSGNRQRPNAQVGVTTNAVGAFAGCVLMHKG